MPGFESLQGHHARIVVPLSNRESLTFSDVLLTLVESGAYGALPGPLQHLLEITSKDSDRMVHLTTGLIELERVNLGN